MLAASEEHRTFSRFVCDDFSGTITRDVSICGFCSSTWPV